MNRYRCSRSGYILNLRCLNACGIFVTYAANPLIFNIVLIEEFTLTTAGDRAMRLLIIFHIMKMKANLTVRVWPESMS